jgi:hypothetical protein
MTATATREIVCENCGDGLDEFSDEIRSRIGKCCEDLPAPWRRDPETGLYTRGGTSQAAYEADEEVYDEDDETPDHPACGSCGSERFEITAREWQQWTGTAYLDAFHQEPGPALLYDAGDIDWEDRGDADDFNIQGVTCRDCGAAYHGDLEQA